MLRFHEFLFEERFPKKAVDVNSVEDPDGFWAQDLREACRDAGVSFGRQEKVADLVFLLNMLAMRWQDKRKGHGR